MKKKKTNKIYSKNKAKKKATSSLFTAGAKKILNLFSLSEETKKMIISLFLFILSIILLLSYFDLSGHGGETLKQFLSNLFGNLSYFIPFFLLFLIIFVRLKTVKNFLFAIVPIAFFLIFIVSAFLSTINQNGGVVGDIIAEPLICAFDNLASGIIFAILILALLFPFYKPLAPTLNSLLTKYKKFQQKREKEKELEQIKDIAKQEFLKKEKEVIFSNDTEKKRDKKSSEKIGTAIRKIIKIEDYKNPPLDLLAKEKNNSIDENTIENQKIIKKTLENFNIPVEMSDVSIGPTVTQYALKPVKGIKLSKIVALSNDLALSLAAHPIRIEAPIPGKSLVGIEVPNKKRIKITLRSLLEAENLSKTKEYENDTFYIPLGRDVAGSPVYFNLFKMPHLLVAGATGTGKTVFLNSLITSLIFRNSPDTLKLILIDPKRVEFANYNDIPHLLCPVISDPNKAIHALNWLIIEMERRFDMLLELGVRDIISYNKIIEDKRKTDELQAMPYIVLVLDELADLMNVSGKDLEAKIMRLAQKARAVGIHLVLATQRPSVNVLTGVIKANIVARIAFTVASQVDSRTILDTVGAEKLIGNGDMLFMSPTSLYPKRIQGAFISEKEVDKIVDWISINVEKKDSLIDALSTSLDDVLKGNYNDSQMNFQTDSGQDGFFDPLYEEGKQIIIDNDRASTSLLQRRLKIGYARAARLIDMMEQKGVVGPARGAKPRKILIDRGVENETE